MVDFKSYTMLYAGTTHCICKEQKSIKVLKKTYSLDGQEDGAGPSWIVDGADALIDRLRLNCLPLFKLKRKTMVGFPLQKIWRSVDVIEILKRTSS